MRTAILCSIVPGMLAAVAIFYAARHVLKPATRERRPIKLQVRPVLKGRLGRLFVGMSAFEFGNAAATLMILRATQLLTPSRGEHRAAQIAILLYVGYNLAGTLSSLPGGHLSDRRSAVHSLVVGTTAFLGAYLVFAAAGDGASILVLLGAFVLAGVGIGFAETAEAAAVAGMARRIRARFGVRTVGRRAEPGELRGERRRRHPMDGGVGRGRLPLAGGMDGHRAGGVPHHAPATRRRG